MNPPQLLRTTLDWSLCVLLIPAALVSLDYLGVGLGYGFGMWRADRPFAILLWFAVVAFPMFVGFALNKSIKAKDLRTTLYLSICAWAFVGFWLWENFVWMPWAHGGPWGW